MSLGHELNQPGRQNHFQKQILPQKQTGHDRTGQDIPPCYMEFHVVTLLYHRARCIALHRHVLPITKTSKTTHPQPYAQTFARLNETIWNPIICQAKTENKAFPWQPSHADSLRKTI